MSPPSKFQTRLVASTAHDSGKNKHIFTFSCTMHEKRAPRPLLSSVIRMPPSSLFRFCLFSISYPLLLQRLLVFFCLLLECVPPPLLPLVAVLKSAMRERKSAGCVIPDTCPLPKNIIFTSIGHRHAHSHHSRAKLHLLQHSDIHVGRGRCRRVPRTGFFRTFFRALALLRHFDPFRSADNGSIDSTCLRF